jgi:hypothetical protein
LPALWDPASDTCKTLTWWSMMMMIIIIIFGPCIRRTQQNLLGDFWCID